MIESMTAGERLSKLEGKVETLENSMTTLTVEIINIKQRLTIGIWILAGTMVGLKALSPVLLQVAGIPT